MSCMNSRAGIVVWLMACAVFLYALNVHPASPAWKPDRPVEFVVGAGAGGSLDVTARTLQKIWQDEKLVDVSVNVVNRPGGGGMVAAAYVNQHAGDGHFLLISAPPLLTNSILGKSKFSYKDLTPVALLYSQYIVFAVRADSPTKTPTDLTERLKTDSGTVSFGFGGTLGNLNHVAVGAVTQAAGGDTRKLKIVVFPSANDAMTALLGGHIELVAAGASIVLPHFTSGKARVIASSAPARAPGPFSAVPTWKELGINVVVDNWVGIMGPKGMAPEQVAYWDHILSKSVQSGEWKKALRAQTWETNYLDSKRTRAFLDEQGELLRTHLTRLGLLAK